MFAALILLASLALTAQVQYAIIKLEEPVCCKILLLLSLTLWSKHVVIEACYFQTVIQLDVNVHFFFIR
jgi:hypothetical protein